MNNENIALVDVRKASEYNSERAVEAINAPLDYINDSMKLLDPTNDYYVHCAGGYRSVVFISILQARGYRNLVNVTDGFTAMKKTNKFNLTAFVCPTTLL
jgi:rhodanese-related sulfurtransferase